MRSTLIALGCLLALSASPARADARAQRVHNFDVHVENQGERYVVRFRSQLTAVEVETHLLAQSVRLYGISDKLLVYSCFAGTYFSCSSAIYAHDGSLVLERTGDLIDIEREYVLTSETVFASVEGEDFIQRTYLLTDVDRSSHREMTFVRTFDPKCGPPEIVSAEIQSGTQILVTTQDRCATTRTVVR